MVRKAFLFKNDLWEKVTKVFSIKEFLVKLLRITDGDKPINLEYVVPHTIWVYEYYFWLLRLVIFPIFLFI